MYYAISNGGCYYSHHEMSSTLSDHYFKIPDQFVESNGFKVDDIITMRVNVPNQTIAYYVGGYDQNPVKRFRQKIEFRSSAKYCMTIELGYPGSGVQLVRFRKMLSKFE